jgi:hypothetical protein
MDFNLFKQIDSIVEGKLLTGEFQPGGRTGGGRPAISAAGAAGWLRALLRVAHRCSCRVAAVLVAACCCYSMVPMHDKTST